jgi:hypothetical protein
MEKEITINGTLYRLVEEPKKAEKKVLKYPNGAVVEAPEMYSEYYNIDTPSDVTKYLWICDSLELSRLKNQNIFLTKEEAEKALDVELTHDRLLKKIIEINAENDWVADFKNPNQNKYFLYWCNGDRDKSWSMQYIRRTGTIYMCEQAKDYMMSDAISGEDFKKFLKIYE